MRTKLHTLLRAAILVGVVAPLVPLFIWSFAHRWFFPALLPTEWSGRAWQYVLSDTARVSPALVNSTIVAFAVTLLAILIGLPAGRALGLHNFRGKTAVIFLILAPTIMPVIAVAMGIHIAFLRLGLADSRLGVILAHLVPVLPYVVLTPPAFLPITTPITKRRRALWGHGRSKFGGTSPCPPFGRG
jgi:putative spermidine/putrescine transport system permease protein